MYSIPIYIALAFISILVLRFLQTRYAQRLLRAEKKRSHGCLPAPKYPHKDPFLGLDLILKENTLVETNHYLLGLQERHTRYGHTLWENLLGWWVIQTDEPENIKAILATNANDWGFGFLRQAAFRPLLGDGIFTLEGKAWEHSRAFLRPQFVKQQYGSAEMFERHIHNLIKAIPTNGETVDLQKLFFNYTLDAATDFLFGESVNALLPEKESAGAELAAAFYEAQFEISEKMRMGPLAFLPAPRRFVKACKRCHDWIDGHVKRALEVQQNNKRSRTDPSDGSRAGTSKERFVLLEEIVEETHDPIRIRSEMVSILIAGRDTTAAALSNLWFTLARRPDIVDNLRKEVGELDGQKPTFERLKSMKYLQWTIHEALRLYPPVPLNVREATVDTILPLGGGPDGKAPVFVSKGETVFYNVAPMQRRIDLWGEDAEEFRPERWENRKTGWEFLPFNGGPRICLGQQFALTEIGYTTVRLLQEYKAIEKRDDTEWAELLTLICAVKSGCQVALTPT